MSKFKSLIPAVSMCVLVSLSQATQGAVTQQSSEPASSQPAPTRVSSAIQEKKLTKRVDPVYPKDAFDAKLTGIINLETTIDADGKVKSVRPIGNGNELLTKAAIDAVKQWVYKPTKVNGMNIEVVTIVAINFRIGE